jgi:hypothetical protein
VAFAALITTEESTQSGITDMVVDHVNIVSRLLSLVHMQFSPALALSVEITSHLHCSNDKSSVTPTKL